MKQPRGRYVLTENGEFLHGYPVFDTPENAKKYINKGTVVPWGDVEICELVPVEFIPGDKDEA